MASLKAEKPVGTKVTEQPKKEGSKASEAAPKAAASKPAPKKAAPKAQKTKRKGKSGKSSAEK